MPRRMEIELTSKVDDDTWTWRAAGAKQPKGIVAAKLLPDGSKVSEVLRGGIPAVRQAIDTQNEQLRAGGQPAIKADPLLALAEELLPRLKSAEWQDRAEAARAAGDDISLRDLRSVVTSADAARDDD